MEQPIPDAASALTLRLPPGDWEDVLDSLDAAAERTSADIDCDTCTTTTTACARHDGDWARIDRLRALAIQLRDQLTATPPPTRMAHDHREGNPSMIHVLVYHNVNSRFMPYEHGHRLNVATSHWLPDADLDAQAVADWAWHAFNADLDMLEPNRATGIDGETTFLAAVAYRLLGHRSLSVGDVIEIRAGATTQWLACDPYGWRPIIEPVNRGGTPLTAVTVYRHLQRPAREQVT